MIFALRWLILAGPVTNVTMGRKTMCILHTSMARLAVQLVSMSNTPSLIIRRCYTAAVCDVKYGIGYSHMDFEKKSTWETQKGSAIADGMALKQLELAEKSSIYLICQLFKRLNHCSSAHYSRCYWPIQYHKCLVPLNIQPEDLSIVHSSSNNGHT